MSYSAMPFSAQALCCVLEIRESLYRELPAQNLPILYDILLLHLNVYGLSPLEPSLVSRPSPTRRSYAEHISYSTMVLAVRFRLAFL